MTVIEPQRNKLILGTRAFDDKPLPSVRAYEYVEPTNYEREKLKKRGTLVAIQRLLAHQLHWYIAGQSRIGKTGSSIIPALQQMLLPYDETWLTLGGEQRTRESRSAIVAIDYKCDKAFRHSVQRMASAAGRTVKDISLNPATSWRFNALGGFTGKADDPANLSANLLTSLNHDYGNGYGANFYTVQALCLLFDVCGHLSKIKRNGGMPNATEAMQYIKKNSRFAPRDSDSLLSTLSLISHYKHLQPSADDPHVVDMKDVILNGDVVIVSVDALNQGPMARLLGGLVLAALLAAATQIASEHSGNASPLPHTFCVIDEFQHAVSRNAQNVLTGAAGVGLSLCLCTQSSETLKLKDLDLAQVVWDNCAIKLIHTCYSEQDIRNLQGMSRETIRSLGSRTVACDFRYHGRQAFSNENESDRLEPLLTRREILEVSATKNRCFVIISDGSFDEPIPTDTYFCETWEQHLENRVTPWPDAPSPSGMPEVDGGDSTSIGQHTRPTWLAAHLSPNKNPKHAERIAQFKQLLSKLRDEELPSTSGGL